MNKTGPNAEITVRNARKILPLSDSSARRILENLVQTGYLTVDTEHIPHIYSLQHHAK